MGQETTETFDVWAVVELFGHGQIAGRVTEQQIAGDTFLRVDVPALDDQQGFTRFYGPKAIYSITPMSEELARRAARALRPKPMVVHGVILPERQLPEPDYDDGWED